MKKYFFLFALAAAIISGCGDDEEKQTCSCSSSHTHFVSVDSTGTIAIPNAFSPNGDGVNEEFRVYGRGVSSFSFEVNDGNNTLFQTTDIDSGWNGRMYGTVPDCQTVYYLVDVTFTNGSVKSFTGTATVFKTGTTPCPENILDCVYGANFDGFDFNPNISNGETFNCP